MNSKHLFLISLLALPALAFGSPAIDRKIEDAAKASYNFHTVLENHVSVHATDGVVTLTGVVQDADERDLAVDTVENLPGVTAVKNQLMLKPTYAEHSDAWMAVKIRSRLLVKADVSATATTVAVQDGVATLSGAAENSAQKELTGLYAAEIDGVKSVKNNLEVADKAASPTIGERIDDASITSQVKYALIRHKSTSAVKTRVTTTEGAIVITGEAASDAEKTLVSKLAKDVRGVRSVTNHMTIKG